MNFNKFLMRRWSIIKGTFGTNDNSVYLNMMDHELDRGKEKITTRSSLKKEKKFRDIVQEIIDDHDWDGEF